MAGSSAELRPPYLRSLDDDLGGWRESTDASYNEATVLETILQCSLPLAGHLSTAVGFWMVPDLCLLAPSV